MAEIKRAELSTVFSTPWFRITKKNYEIDKEPFYVLDTTDAVCIITTTSKQQILLVRQYRPAVDCETLELPSGHVQDNETPEETAKRELLEETGYKADSIELLGNIFPNTTRLGYKLWCFFAPKAIKVKEPEPDEINNLVFCNPSNLSSFIKNGKIKNALDIAAIFLAMQNDKIRTRASS